VVGAQEAGVKEARVGAAKEAESTLPKVREGAAEEGTAAGVKAGVMEEASKVVTRGAVIQGVTAVMEVAASQAVERSLLLSQSCPSHLLPRTRTARVALEVRPHHCHHHHCC
jgi:hypothetical protein